MAGENKNEKFQKECLKCPDCGSVRRVSQMALEGETLTEKEKAEMTAMHTWMFMHKGPIMSVIVGAHVDVCYDCLRVYAIGVDKKRVLTSQLGAMMGGFRA